jgi:ATP-dependent RNA helicase DDX54/DBP10
LRHYFTDHLTDVPMYYYISITQGVRAVVLSPTRELALQTHKVTKQLGRFTDLRYTVLVGGSPMEQQFESLADDPDVIIATPGRLMHHLLEVKFSLKTVQYCVFDEADRYLNDCPSLYYV